MSIISIVAMDQQDAIGKDNKLLCSLKDDLAYFKGVTEGGIVVMGSKTYESIGKPLPNRFNIVLSRNKDYPDPPYDNCRVMHSVMDVVAFSTRQNKNLYVIGGAEIYKLFLPICRTLIITHIHHTFEDADTYFPEIDWSEWDHGFLEGRCYPDQRNEYGFDTVIYTRNK